MSDASASQPLPQGGRIAALRLLVAVLWVGSLWALGYIAAPAAFATLESSDAGRLVSSLLTRSGWLSIGCALLLVALLRRSTDLMPARKRHSMLLVLAMLACALVMFVGLQPAMAHLRELAGAQGVRASSYWTQFAIMHGVSQLFHVLESLLGAWLIVRLR